MGNLIMKLFRIKEIKEQQLREQDMEEHAEQQLREQDMEEHAEQHKERTARRSKQYEIIRRSLEKELYGQTWNEMEMNEIDMMARMKIVTKTQDKATSMDIQKSLLQ